MTGMQPFIIMLSGLMSPARKWHSFLYERANKRRTMNVASPVQEVNALQNLSSDKHNLSKTRAAYLLSDGHNPFEAVAKRPHALSVIRERHFAVLKDLNSNFQNSSLT